MVHFNIETAKSRLGYINLKYVTNTQPIPLTLIG